MRKNMLTPGRMLHMHGVAEYMMRHAEEYALSSSAMYLVGLLHDIGYIYGKEDHELSGANLLRKYFSDGSETRLVCFVVETHGLSPEDYIRIYGRPLSSVVLLWDADMRIDETGQDVGYARRLNGVEARYGKDSEEYRICAEKIAWLKEHIDEFRYS